MPSIKQQYTAAFHYALLGNGDAAEEEVLRKLNYAELKALGRACGLLRSWVEYAKDEWALARVLEEAQKGG